MQGSGGENSMQTQPDPALPVEPRARTEDELLEREERRARADLQRALTGLRNDLLGSSGLSRQVVEHPLVASLLSAAAGFALARPVRRVGRATRTIGLYRLAMLAGDVAKHVGVGGAASRAFADVLRQYQVNGASRRPR